MMYQRKLKFSAIIIIVCSALQSSAKPPDLKWFDRCRDTTQCPYGAGVYHDNSLICDGGVISKHHVVTAASCFKSVKSSEEYSIRVGAIDDNSGKFYNVENITIHSLYNKNDGTDNNYDIAVMKIREREGFDYDTKIAFLPHEEMENNKFEAEMFGWAHMTWRKGWDYLTHHPVTVFSDPQRCDFLGKPVKSHQMCGIILNKTYDYVKYAVYGSPLIYNKTLIGVLINNVVDMSAQVYLKIYDHVTWISRAMY